MPPKSSYQALLGDGYTVDNPPALFLVLLLVEQPVTSLTMLEEAKSFDVISVGKPHAQFVEKNFEVPGEGRRPAGPPVKRSHVHGIASILSACIVVRDVCIRLPNTTSAFVNVDIGSFLRMPRQLHELPLTINSDTVPLGYYLTRLGCRGKIRF